MKNRARIIEMVLLVRKLLALLFTLVGLSPVFFSLGHAL